MNIKNFIRKMKKRFRLFGEAMELYAPNVISHSCISPFYYLLHDEEDIIKWHNKEIEQLQQLWKKETEEK